MGQAFPKKNGEATDIFQSIDILRLTAGFTFKTELSMNFGPVAYERYIAYIT